MVPGATVMCRLSLATTAPNCLVMPLSSSIYGLCLLSHGIGHRDFAGDDAAAGVFRVPDRLCGHDLPVELVDDVADTVALEAEHLEAAREPPLDDLPDHVVDDRVDTLDHAGQHEAGLD